MAAAEGVAVYPVFSTLWAVANAVLNVWLATVLFRAGNACLRLEEKGRQGMIFYAIAILSWMGTSLVLYCIFESPSDLTNTPMSVAFLALGFAIAYPAAVLFTMTDERVKRAFVAHATPAAKPPRHRRPDVFESWINQHRDNPDN
jgi:hypothetical protein